VRERITARQKRSMSGNRATDNFMRRFC
jgi:hypothetical protein